MSFRGAGTAVTTGTTTTVAIPYPTPGGGIAAGDCLVILIDIAGTVYPTLPSGWTAGPKADSNATGPCAWSAVKIAAGGETGSLNVTVPAQVRKAQMLCFDGIDQTTPLDNAGSVYSSSVGATAYTLPAITTTLANAPLIISGAASTGTGTFTPPTTQGGGWTETMDNATLAPKGCVDYLIWTGSGSTGTADLVCSNSVKGSAVLLALRPAAPDAWTFAVTESAGVTDSFAITQKPVKQDSVDITDSFLRQVSRALNSSDLVNLSDSLAVIQGKTFKDSVNLTDVFSASQNKTFIDLVTMVDTFAKSQGKTFLDVVNITDSASFVLESGGVVYTIDIVDLVGITDALNFPLVFKDLVGITDFIAITQKPVDSDSLGITDSFTIQMTKSKALASLVGLTDQFNVQQLKTYKDNVNLTDNLNFRYGKVYSDIIGLTDKFNMQWGKIFGDSVGITDTFTALIGRLLPITDIVNITDSISFILDVGDPSASFGSMVDRKRIVVQVFLGLTDDEVRRLTIDDLAFMYWAFRSGLVPVAELSTADHFVFVSPNGEHFIRDITP